MFNEKVLAILGQLSSITDTVILKHPVSMFMSEQSDILARWNVSRMDPDVFPDLPLFKKLPQFLASVKLLKDPKFEFSDNVVHIKSGESDIDFVLSNAALMSDYFLDDQAFSKTDSVPSVCEFDLSPQDIASIKAAAGVFKELTDLVFVSKDGQLTLTLGNIAKFNNSDNAFKIRKNAETTKEFKFGITMENIVKLPPSEYTVKIKYNSRVDNYRVVYHCKSIPELDIMMAQKL